ncbi:hypothetical protein [Xanthomonas citri]|uniref:hypothetical protein n=1 Tax=Xanthomonas citri TaxID=346 RepID=UPI0018DF02BE|nr:hypothetical protein [Xanthomonas citri]
MIVCASWRGWMLHTHIACQRRAKAVAHGITRKMPSITLNIVPAARRNADSMFLHQHFSRGHFRAHYRHAANAMSNAWRKPKNPGFQGFFIRSFSNLISDRRI